MCVCVCVCVCVCMYIQYYRPPSITPARFISSTHREPSNIRSFYANIYRAAAPPHQYLCVL